MARKRSNLSEGKQSIISALLEEYDIHSADDIQNALKDLLGGTIQSMMEAELDNHPGYEPYVRTENSNTRNERKPKIIRSKYGEMNIQGPQDRDSSFHPQVVQKRQKDISHIDDKIIAMNAKGLSSRNYSGSLVKTTLFDFLMNHILPYSGFLKLKLVDFIRCFIIMTLLRMLLVSPLITQVWYHSYQI